MWSVAGQKCHKQCHCTLKACHADLHVVLTDLITNDLATLLLLYGMTTLFAAKVLEGEAIYILGFEERDVYVQGFEDIHLPALSLGCVPSPPPPPLQEMISGLQILEDPQSQMRCVEA